MYEENIFTCDVHLTLKDGKKIQTFQPAIDELLRVVDEHSKTCGDVGIATE